MATNLFGYTLNENKAQELADSFSLVQLQDRLDNIYGEMEQEAEPEGGPIADQYADEIEAYEAAIRIKQGKGNRGRDYEPTYDDVLGDKGKNPHTIKYIITINGDKSEAVKFIQDDLTRDLKHFAVNVELNDDNFPQPISVFFHGENYTKINSRIQKLIKTAMIEFLGKEMGHDIEGPLNDTTLTSDEFTKSSKFDRNLDEQGFDDRLKAAGGFSDEEFDDITSRDPGDPFPQDDIDYLDDIDTKGYKRARDLIEKLRKEYRDMSDKELDSFSVEMVLHFLDNTAAITAAKVHFGTNMTKSL